MCCYSHVKVDLSETLPLPRKIFLIISEYGRVKQSDQGEPTRQTGNIGSFLLFPVCLIYQNA